MYEEAKQFVNTYIVIWSAAGREYKSYFSAEKLSQNAFIFIDKENKHSPVPFYWVFISKGFVEWGLWQWFLETL